MIAKRFEDLIVWQKGIQLAKLIYKAFENSRDFGFNDQIQRAAVSISNNIAEGFDRKSDKTFYWFLNVARGSCSEVRSMLYLALELEKINKETFDHLLEQTNEISRMISGLSKKLCH